MAAKTSTLPTDKNWYKDRYQHVVLQRKILMVITVASLVAAIAAMLLTISLVPQKSIEPYVIQVDSKTGITQVVKPAKAKELTANEAVNNFYIVRYLRAREGFNASDLFNQYHTVRVLSEPRNVYQEFLASADANNPQSGTAQLGSNGKRSVKIKSITYLESTVVQVRVLLIDKVGGNVTKEHHKIITLKFDYAPMPLNKEDRYLNPLGFRVIDYTIVDEVL